jgi:anti-sigma B factor antagonist
LQFITEFAVTGFVKIPIVCTDNPGKMMSTQEFQLILLQPQQCLDIDGGKALEMQLAGLMPQRQALWVIDLAKVDFMDSAGLVSLITGLKAARQSGCRLVLCNVQPPVRLVLELTQLDSVFEIFDSYDAVLTTIKTPALVG